MMLIIMIKLPLQKRIMLRKVTLSQLILTLLIPTQEPLQFPQHPSFHCFIDWIKKDDLGVLDERAYSLFSQHEITSDVVLYHFLQMEKEEVPKHFSTYFEYMTYRPVLIELRCLYSFLEQELEENDKGKVKIHKYHEYAMAVKNDLGEGLPNMKEAHQLYEGTEMETPPAYTRVSPTVVAHQQEGYSSTNPNIVSENGSVYFPVGGTT